MGEDWLAGYRALGAKNQAQRGWQGADYPPSIRLTMRAA